MRRRPPELARGVHRCVLRRARVAGSSPRVRGEFLDRSQGSRHDLRVRQYEDGRWLRRSVPSGLARRRLRGRAACAATEPESARRCCLLSIALADRWLTDATLLGYVVGFSHFTVATGSIIRIDASSGMLPPCPAVCPAIVINSTDSPRTAPRRTRARVAKRRLWGRTRRPQLRDVAISQRIRRIDRRSLRESSAHAGQ